MRPWAVLTAFALLLSGCSGGGGDASDDDEESAADLGDLDVAATETTGILVGVVVDEAIRPLEGANITITGPDARVLSESSDGEGRFAFGELAPGSYIVDVALLNFQGAQTTAAVVAGDDDPRVLRVQLARLFSQASYTEQVKYDGFLACAFSFGTSSTCVNDYTRITGEQCVPTSPPQCFCAGGCFRDQELAKAAGNIREYVTVIGPGWQSIVEEMAWENSSPATPVTSDELHVTISYFARPDAGHWFGAFTSANPLRGELRLGEEHESAQYSDDQPTVIPPEGIADLFVFFSVGGGIGVNQKFQSFQTNFYYGLPPEGWSFVNGDPLPF